VSKNIWILNHYAASPDMAGGTRHHDFGRELVKRGYKVTIFASGFNHSTKKYIKVHSTERYKIEDYDGVRFVWLNTIPYYGNNWRRILNMVSYGVRVFNVCRGIEKPNVIIGSSVHPFAVVAAWWLAKRYKSKFIFEVRDLWPQTAIEMGVIKATGVPARLLYIWEKFMYKRADKIIVLLPNAKEYIEKCGIESQKIVWIPNGVDLEQFDEAVHIVPSSEAIKAFEKYKDKFKVVYSGAHGPANDLETVIDAAYLLAKKSADVHFFLIGDGPEKKKLIKKVQEKAVDNITFLDPVPKYQVPAILQQSDLLISGKPVIMSGNAINNIIQEAKAGITVEPENPEALSEGIIKIQEMTPEERQKLGANGRAYVEKYHNTRALTDILEKIL
jgi:glycosyltransferase involved in cell wall biosynthesis